MAANKINIDRETIQAIAQELNKLQQNQGAQACACNTGAISEKPKNLNKNTGAEKQQKPTRSGKNVGAIGIILVWAVVLVILLVKLAPYI